MKQKPEAKKSEPKSPLKDEDFVPWNGVTLNRCLAVAAIAALLSVGFQVLQESADSDDLAEAENEVWTSPESNDQKQSEPWFFEGWFGSSTPSLPDIEEPDIEEPEISETAESDISAEEEQEQPEAEESEQTDDEIEAETEPVIEEPEENEQKEEIKKEKPKTEQWGLKPKSKYMESKGMKIKRASEGGSEKKGFFPFNIQKKPKDSAKPPLEEKEKPYKDTKYQKKYSEKKYDYPKKQEYEKSFKKERKEEHKYIKEDKGKKEDKQYKGYKQYHSEKDYKKKYEPRHHG